VLEGLPLTKQYTLILRYQKGSSLSQLIVRGYLDMLGVRSNAYNTGSPAKVDKFSLYSRQETVETDGLIVFLPEKSCGQLPLHSILLLQLSRRL
jgi:hypothetical protein